ncbi:MAG: fibrillarin-like rRNA/tRNA 2'-O-methyltransferase [Candidatus Diapherotrites archaeon]
MGKEKLIEKFKGVYSSNKKILTKNLTPKKKVYGEELIEIEGIECRIWNPFRSKLAAAINNGLKELPLKEKSNVLYLGIAEGTTASHISDVIGERGIIAGVDISARAMPKLIELSESRPNILPVLADAAKPESYAGELKEIKFDLLYQDIAQKNQAEIFLKNARLFLKKKAKGLIAIKAKSISQQLSEKKVFEQETRKLREEFKIIQSIPLEPFHSSHLMVYCEKL